MDFSKAPVPRNEQVLFSRTLDDALDADHDVRYVDRILRSIDFSEWEAKYDLTKGQPPIHPRIIVSVILYGLLCRITSSRMLEEALQMRIDFRWLAEGRSIDHSTLCKFRTAHPDELKKLYVTFAMTGMQLGWVRLDNLAFDATRIRSRNARRASRTRERFTQLKTELEEKYNEFHRAASEADKQDEQRFGNAGINRVDTDIKNVERELAKVNAALAEIQSLEEQGGTVPARVPINDPESRVMPNKNGGFAPNYTPACTVDIDSGMIVDSTVLNVHNEDGEMLNSVDRVREKFDDDSIPNRLLADGLMATGDNISDCAEQGIDLYSPMKTADSDSNPAIREDLTTPVSEGDYDRLPRKSITVGGEKREQLSKDAFVYDADKNVYYCPAGKELSYRGSSTENRQSGRIRTRERYRIEAKICADCPLAELCLRRQGAGRQVTHEEHEAARVAHAKKMATVEATEIYKTRQHASERPFAMIKWFFGVQMFLTRGLSKVSQEFDWLSAGFNLHRLVSLHRARAGPATADSSPPRSS